MESSKDLKRSPVLWALRFAVVQKETDQIY